MIKVGAAMVALPGLVALLVFATAKNNTFILFTLVALGIPAIVAVAIGVILLIAGVWGVTGWPGRPAAIGLSALAAYYLLSRFLHL